MSVHVRLLWHSDTPLKSFRILLRLVITITMGDDLIFLRPSVTYSAHLPLVAT